MPKLSYWTKVKLQFYKRCTMSYHHQYHHPTQCIPLIKKLWTGFGEGKTAVTHTHKGDRGQGSPPARENKET